MIEAADVTRYWLEELEPKQWYIADDALDAEIRQRFEDVWEQARAGRLDHWRKDAEGSLGFIILTDQFPRNMFRGTARAFSTDASALRSAKRAIERGWDMRTPEPGRQFFYLPLMHSELLSDQERCVRLMCERLPGSESNLRHARAHREIIRRFGRFPYRNAALDRKSRPAEQAFLDGPGYRQVLEEIS